MATSSPPARGSQPGSPTKVPSPATNAGGQVTTTFHPEIEADDLSENDSAYADSDMLALSLPQSLTTSLASSVLNYRFENGRRYHAFGEQNQYFLPNDEAQNPHNILDLGTGTGKRADGHNSVAADLYPSAVIIGNDLSPIQPGWSV
ncbi:hypothetical protein ABW19_dt0203184 [Dactylella cylindrospora]|nr:hypothetical protein ABW19_dt0203184 [Dactylella cylindrospora]